MKTIKLDIDNKNLSIQQINRICNTKSMLGLDITDIRMTKTKNGFHIEMDLLNPINDFELVCIQALMNSDYKREIYNLLRVHSKRFKKQKWNVLFIKKIKIK